MAKAKVGFVQIHRLKNSQITTQWPIVSYLLKLGILLYPSFYLLDRVVYPQQAGSMMAIRLGVTAYFIVAYWVATRFSKDNDRIIVLSCLFVASVGISWMCVLSGQGFDSPYYVGLLQVIIISTPLIGIPSKPYVIAIVAIVVQHFILLSNVPGSLSLKGFFTNLFGLVVFSIVSIFMHKLIINLFLENTNLRGILPICANCKKIRDDEGYWRDVAQYISEHSEAQFSHGVCPDCIKKLYPDLDINS